MPPSLFPIALFSSGLLVGGAAAAYAVSSSSASGSSSSAAAIGVPVPVPVQGSAGPILQPGVAPGGFRAPNVAAGEVWKYGVPSAKSDLLFRKAYITQYDRQKQHPAWTAEHLTIANLARAPPLPGADPAKGGSVSRDKSTFMEDEQTPEPFRAKLKDYFRSGYDRGHLVPAADAKISQEAMNETFLLSNIAPQVGEGFNRNYWAYFEDWTRKLTNQFTDVYVFTIPLYLPAKAADGKWRVSYEVIGNPSPSISVPTHWSKVILALRAPRGMDPRKTTEREVSLAGFVMPNAVIPDNAPLESFLVPVEQIEKFSGLELLAGPVKQAALALCSQTTCQPVIRRFDDARKKLAQAPPGQITGGGRPST